LGGIKNFQFFCEQNSISATVTLNLFFLFIIGQLTTDTQHEEISDHNLFRAIDV